MAIDRGVRRSRRVGARPLCAVVLLVVSALPACQRRPDDPLEAARKSLEHAGHRLGAFTPAAGSGLPARRCEAGHVDGVEALLCEFADEESARRAGSGAGGWIGTAATGLTVSEGRVALVLADRDRTDPAGRTLSKVAKSFREAH